MIIMSQLDVNKLKISFSDTEHFIEIVSTMFSARLIWEVTSNQCVGMIISTLLNAFTPSYVSGIVFCICQFFESRQTKYEMKKQKPDESDELMNCKTKFTGHSLNVFSSSAERMSLPSCVMSCVKDLLEKGFTYRSHLHDWKLILSVCWPPDVQIQPYLWSDSR